MLERHSGIWIPGPRAREENQMSRGSTAASKWMPTTDTTTGHYAQQEACDLLHSLHNLHHAGQQEPERGSGERDARATCNKCMSRVRQGAASLPGPTTDVRIARTPQRGSCDQKGGWLIPAQPLPGPTAPTLIGVRACRCQCQSFPMQEAVEGKQRDA